MIGKNAPPAKPSSTPAKPAPPVNASSNKKGPASSSKPTPQSNQKATKHNQADQSKQTNSEPAVATAQNDDQTKIEEKLKLFLNFSKNSSAFDTSVVLVQAQLNLARVYARLKDFNTAQSFYDKVIQKEPKVTIKI